MAKAKKTSTSTTTNTNLQNTLQINGETYNITATTADIANKVKATLTITQKKANSDDDEITEFNGETSVNVSVVPADGGKFSGPISVPNIDDSQEYSGSEVINKTDTENLINKIVAALKGLPNHIFEDGQLSPELDAESGSYKALKIITAEAAGDYKEFEALSESNEYPYIFICKSTGDIWLKSAEQPSVNITEKIKNQVKDSLIGDAPDGVDVEQFTLSFLYNEFKGLQNSLTANNTELKNLKDLINTIDSKIANLLGKTSDSSSSMTIYGTRKYAQELSNNLSNAITEITNGTTTVGLSTTSNQSNTIKVQTADGKTKYYSTIYFGSTTPVNTLGKDGDIYIKIP